MGENPIWSANLLVGSINTHERDIMKVSLLVVFIVILSFATCALGSDVPVANSTWIEGHWVVVEGQQVWVAGYWRAPANSQIQETHVVYVQQPTVVYVQSAPQVIYVQQPQSTFMVNSYYGNGFYGGFHSSFTFGSFDHCHSNFAPRRH